MSIRLTAFKSSRSSSSLSNIKKWKINEIETTLYDDSANCQAQTQSSWCREYPSKFHEAPNQTNYSRKQMVIGSETTFYYYPTNYQCETHTNFLTMKLVIGSGTTLYKDPANCKLKSDRRAVSVSIRRTAISLRPIRGTAVNIKLRFGLRCSPKRLSIGSETTLCKNPMNT